MRPCFLSWETTPRNGLAPGLRDTCAWFESKPMPIRPLLSVLDPSPITLAESVTTAMVIFLTSKPPIVRVSAK